MKEESAFFPIFINMKEKQCVLYGGGTIAARRAEGLLRFGAKVTVVSPRFREGMQRLKQLYPLKLCLKEGVYEPGIPEADFVFSCTDHRETDLCIYRECKSRGIPVNIASDQSLCDFLFPALVEREGLVIGISSGGRDHRKVRQAAKRLREWIGGVTWT